MTKTENLPAYLQEHGSFCLWRYEDRKGKPTKSPYNPHCPQYGAKSNDRSTFSDLKTALAASKGFDGIGVGIFDDITAIDIDHCVSSGTLSDMARDIVETMQAYTEFSPSGEGIRILFRAPGFVYDKEKYYINNQKIGLEVYSAGNTNKYVTVTGNVLNPLEPSELPDRSDRLPLVLEKYMKRSGKDKPPIKVDYTAATAPTMPLVMSDFELIEKAFRAKDGAKFKALWHGDISGYKSESEADQALCNLLAFWTGRDSNRIDTLFRQSGLMRDKWDEKHGAATYGAMTIQKAIEGCKNTYSPQYKRSSDEGGGLPPFIYEDVNEKTGEVKYIVLCPELAQYIRDNEHYFFLRSPGEKPLIFWYNSSRGVYEQVSDNNFKGIIKEPIEKFMPSLVKTKHLEEVFKLLITDLGKDKKPDELDRCTNLINFRNGLLNINTLELVKHSPEILSTIQIPCNWNPQARNMPVFENYIKTLTNRIPACVSLLLQFTGLAISNIRGTIDKNALFLIGKGDSGKSQFLELLKRLVGENNYAAIDFSELENNRFAASKLYRKRLAGDSDMKAMNVAEVTKFKNLTGGDPISIEFKGKDCFTAHYNGALLFCGNDMPKFGGDKGKHVYRRMIIIPCNNAIPKEEQDPLLIEKLCAERESIIYNAVLALKAFIANGFHFVIPNVSEAARQEYMHMNDTVAMFLDEFATIPADAKHRTSTSVAYTAYKAWARESNEYAYSKSDFKKAVARYYNTDESDVIQIYSGTRYFPFSLTPEAQREYMNF